MSESPDTLTPMELLERIIILERDNKALRKQAQHHQTELTTLKAKLADLGKAFKGEVSSTTTNFDYDRAQFKHIYQYLADIHDHLWPLIYKLFPGTAIAQKQWDEIKRKAGRSG